MSAYPQIVFRRDQCCQRKMQPNYPSVAKPCTSESLSGRPHFPAIGNKKRTKPRKVTALKDVSEAGLAGSRPSRGVLPRSHPALAPKVLRWGEDGGWRGLRPKTWRKAKMAPASAGHPGLCAQPRR